MLSPRHSKISYLRAQNGGVQSRLTFNLESLTQQKTNMRAALGRVVDVDIAEESTNLAKYSILNQAAASSGSGQCKHRYRTDASTIRSM